MVAILKSSFQMHFVVVAVLLTSGCSATRLTSRPVDGKKDAEGFRYYLPTPYVLVKKPILLGSTTTARATSHSVTTNAPSAPPAGTRKQPAPPAGLVGQAGSGAQDEPAAEKPEPAKEEEKEEATPPVSEEDGVSIVMMPDYCQQQAVNIEVSNAKLDVELKFVDGWRLEHVKSAADATLAMTSWIDLAKTTLTSAKDIVGAVFGAKTTSEEEEGGSEAQSGRANGKTSTEKQRSSTETVSETWLRPGVYPLFVRTGGKCEGDMTLDKKWFEGHTFERARTKTKETSAKVVSQ